MIIVLLAAVVVVCIGVVVVAVGRGGQLAEFAHDAPPLGLPARRAIAGTDVALLRLPAGPWGYSFRSTDDALRRIAHAITERDTRIAVLERQVAELRAAQPDEDDSGSPWFDRSAPFEGRPARPALQSGFRSVSARTDESAAIAPLTEDKPEDIKPAGESQVGEPEDAKPEEAASADTNPEDGVPGDGVPEEDEPQVRAPARTDSGGAAPQVGGLEEDRPEDREHGDEPEALAAKPADEPGKPADDGTVTNAGGPDEDWVFEDDAEPVVEPLAETGGLTPAAPSPGDRLVASARNPADEQADRSEESDTDPRGEGH